MTSTYRFRTEEETEKIRKENKSLLDRFGEWLDEKGLSAKVIGDHLWNTDFFINEYLLYEDATHAREGAQKINIFLGYWFVKKAMWASCAAIKKNAVSLKKFYTFLYELGEIEKEDLEQLTSTIKEKMPEWLASMERYDDPEISDMAEVWGLYD